ncbi:hypothetical protein QJS04_geneDACA004176 [Acorus gramineus]|uniref:Uncharacterized protein n=1 Tax=Acorus gramineus TaxID=55184 RepID=A0AAV9BFI6_ACOGR|nr:hypothetical protein QJS04_geneDACA004176 [Acorus gramineus]
MDCKGECFLRASGVSVPPPPPPPLLNKKGLVFYTARHPILETRCRISRAPSPSPHSLPTLRRSEVMQVVEANYFSPKNKTAKLSAEHKERIILPGYADDRNRTFPIGEFLRHPSGMESMLNTKALQSFQSLDSNTYSTCTYFSSFHPVQGFRCTGAAKQSIFRLEILFAAFMRNHITWDSNGTEPSLDVDVKLNITLQVYTSPFNLLPISMVEVPGNLLNIATVTGEDPPDSHLDSTK